MFLQGSHSRLGCDRGGPELWWNQALGGGESSKKLETFGEGLISRLFLKADSEQLVSFIILLFPSANHLQLQEFSQHIYWAECVGGDLRNFSWIRSILFKNPTKMISKV